MKFRIMVPVFVFVLMFGTAAYTQPAPAMPAPVMAPAAAPAMVAAPRPVVRLAPRVVPRPAVMVAAPAPMVAAPAPAAPAAPVSEAMVAAPVPVVPVTTTPKADVPVPAPAPKEVPVWKSPSFWVGVVGGPVLGVVLAILLAFGVISKKHLQYLKDKDIVKTADKVVNGFESFAAGTNVKWDDVIAQALRAVVTRVGALTDEQTALVKSVVAERQEQAEKKVGGASSEKTDDDKKDDEPEEKAEDE